MNIDEFIIYLDNYIKFELNDADSALVMLKLSLFWLITQNADFKKAGVLIDELTKEKGKNWYE